MDNKRELDSEKYLCYSKDRKKKTQSRMIQEELL